MKRKPPPATFPCPHCGADVRVGAKFCRECGSDDENGWSDDADDYGAADLPAGYGGEDEFDDDEYLTESPPRQAASPYPRILIIAIVVIVGLLLLRNIFLR